MGTVAELSVDEPVVEGEELLLSVSVNVVPVVDSVDDVRVMVKVVDSVVGTLLLDPEL